MNTQKKIENILKDAGIEEFKKEAQMIIESVSGLTKEQLLLSDDIKNIEEIKHIALKRAKTKAPIQHLLGHCWFMNERYIVNNSVLIPRDETEILVRSALDKIKKTKNKNEKIDILDIGTGSGCISCALAKNLADYKIEILAVDISAQALETAINNVIELDLVKKVVLRKSDLFSKIRKCEKFDLIISNPPYIPLKDKKILQKEVHFEPDSALFAKDEKGIEFYKKITAKAPEFLKEGGFLAYELGVFQSEFVKKLMEQDFSNIEIIKDLASIDRVIIGTLKI